MGIIVNTLSTMAIGTDPTASMMLEIEKETIVNPFPSAHIAEKVTSCEDTVSSNSVYVSALSIAKTSLDTPLLNTFESIDNTNSPAEIVKGALEQIKNLNYIEVDDAIDRKIDAYFAKRQSKKAKKIIYKRT